MRMRLRHATELPWHFLHGILCHIRQHQAELVGSRGSGTRVRRTVAADRARLPLHGMVVHVGHKGVLNRRQQRLECVCSEAGHGPYAPGTGGDLFGAWHRHL
jgi:hypothetical protein